MTEQEKISMTNDDKHRLAARVKGNADASNPRFICMARDLGKTFRWGRNGISWGADSAIHTFKVTKDFTKKLVPRPKPHHKPGPNENVLLQKFGSIVAECSDSSWLSLQNNTEFWKIVEQLYSLNVKFDTKKVGEKKTRQEKTQMVIEDKKDIAEVAGKAISKKTKPAEEKTGTKKSSSTLSSPKQSAKKLAGNIPEDKGALKNARDKTEKPSKSKEVKSKTENPFF